MILITQHIAHSFGDKEVLRDVSFQLAKGKATVLMGTNGSGKTTLFNIISGFIKADQGHVLLHNEIIDKMPPYQRNSMGIGRSFQDMRLIGELSVLENVLLAFPNQQGEKWWNALLRFSSVQKEEQKNLRKAKLILEQCFITEVAGSKAAEISYGQQKLLNLACCIANDAQVLLLDEPVAGVNPVYREKLELVIQTLKNNKALLIIEHHTDFIQAVANEILFLNEGKIKAFPSYSELKNDLYVQEAYI